MMSIAVKLYAPMIEQYARKHTRARGSCVRFFLLSQSVPQALCHRLTYCSFPVITCHVTTSHVPRMSCQGGHAPSAWEVSRISGCSSSDGARRATWTWKRPQGSESYSNSDIFDRNSFLIFVVFGYGTENRIELSDWGSLTMQGN